MQLERTIDTPVGPMRLVAEGEALVGVQLNAAPSSEGSRAETSEILDQAARELGEYFAGTRREFSVPLRALGGTEFQRRVWAALAELPFGSRASYSDIAVRIGRPRAVRAVGAANARNPHAIMVPCHRVIGANGTLTGYGGGLPMKEWLLAHEADVVEPR